MLEPAEGSSMWHHINTYLVLQSYQTCPAQCAAQQKELKCLTELMLIPVLRAHLQELSIQPTEPVHTL